MSYDRMGETEQRLKTEIDALLKQAADTDAAEDAQYGKGKRGDGLPEELARRETRLAKLQKAKAEFHPQRQRRNGELMKTASERIHGRLKKDRPMTVISFRMPEDVIEELKEIAPALGFSGYQPLIRAYIGQGLRKDQARMENSQVQLLTESLRKHGIDDGVISAAVAEGN